MFKSCVSYSVLRFWEHESFDVGVSINQLSVKVVSIMNRELHLLHQLVYHLLSSSACGRRGSVATIISMTAATS